MIGEEQRLIDNLDMIWTIAEDCSMAGYEDMNLGLKEIFVKGVGLLTDEGAKELKETMESRGA